MWIEISYIFSFRERRRGHITENVCCTLAYPPSASLRRTWIRLWCNRPARLYSHRKLEVCWESMLLLHNSYEIKSLVTLLDSCVWICFFNLIILSALLQIVMGRLVCVSINVKLCYDLISRKIDLYADDYEITHLRVPDVCYPSNLAAVSEMNAPGSTPATSAILSLIGKPSVASGVAVSNITGFIVSNITHDCWPIESIWVNK